MNKIILILLITIFYSCAGSKIVSLAKGGQVAQKEFHEKIVFNYTGKHIFVDVIIDGKTYNFLFDTGWEITSIDKNLLAILKFQPSQKQKSSGSSFQTHKTQYGVLEALSIGDITFQNIGIGIEDLSFINSSDAITRKVDGIIGTNILRKANWQIDYEHNTIEFSNDLNKLKTSPNATAIKMTPRNSSGWGYNWIKLTLNNVEESFIFDTGSSGNFTGDFDLLDKLKAANQSNLPIIKNENPNKQIVNIAHLTFGKINLENEPLSIEKGVSSLIGNDFLENYTVTIDWTNNILYLLPIKN